MPSYANDYFTANLRVALPQPRPFITTTIILSIVFLLLLPRNPHQPLLLRRLTAVTLHECYFAKLPKELQMYPSVARGQRPTSYSSMRARHPSLPRIAHKMKNHDAAMLVHITGHRLNYNALRRRSTKWRRSAEGVPTKWRSAEGARTKWRQLVR